MRNLLRVITEIMIGFLMMILKVLYLPVQILILILDYTYSLLIYIIPVVVFAWYIYLIYLLITW